MIELEAASSAGLVPHIVEALATCIMPAEAGGLEVAAYYLATDQRWVPAALVQLLRSRLTGTGQDKTSPAKIEAALAASLARLFVVHCQNSLELLAAVCAIQSQAAVQEVRLVVVDSLNSFYWQERSGHSGPATTAAVATALGRLRDECGAVIVGVRQALGSQSGDGSSNVLPHASTSHILSASPASAAPATASSTTSYNGNTSHNPNANNSSSSNATSGSANPLCREWAERLTRRFWIDGDGRMWA